MKLRRKAHVLCGLLMVLFAGCTLFNRTPSPSRPAPIRRNKPSAGSLTSYFPQKVGTSWIYEGFAEYGHRMVLTSITKDPQHKRSIREISGSVADMSDGESKRNFHFKLRYIFTPIAIQEEVLESDTPFPHTVKNITLLKLPIRKGARWRQNVVMNGKSSILRAVITDIRTEPSIKAKVVRVRYRMPMTGMPNGIYEEVREFAKGIGVYRFEKTFGPNTTDRFNYAFRELIPPAKFTDAKHQVTFLYPSDWKKTSDHRFEGFGGFFQVSAIRGPKSIDEAARNEASHTLRPYGSSPTIQRLNLRGLETRLIMPSPDQAREMKKQAALIIRYAKPVTIQGNQFSFLVIYADMDHIHLIAKTLKLM